LDSGGRGSPESGKGPRQGRGRGRRSNERLGLGEPEELKHGLAHRGDREGGEWDSQRRRATSVPLHAGKALREGGSPS